MSHSTVSNPHGRGFHTYCGCLECYCPDREVLEYDYSNDDTKRPQPLPRIRERGEYYIDSYNDQPWSWTFGTHENVSLDWRRHVGGVDHSLCCVFRFMVWELIRCF